MFTKLPKGPVALKPKIQKSPNLDESLVRKLVGYRINLFKELDMTLEDAIPKLMVVCQ